MYMSGEFGDYELFSVEQEGEPSLGRGGQLNVEPGGGLCAPGKGHVPADCQQCRTPPSFLACAQNPPPWDMLDISLPGDETEQKTWLHSPQSAQHPSCSTVHRGECCQPHTGQGAKPSYNIRGAGKNWGRGGHASTGQINE